jgi:hypothetical protein
MMKPTLTLLFCLSAGFQAPAAFGEMAESSTQMATDTLATNMFLLNPAVQKPEGTRVGLFGMRSSKKTKLNQSSTGEDTIESETSDEYLVYAASADLGAGAGLGLQHQTLFRKVLSNVSSRRNQPALEELHKIQHTAARLYVELTDQVRAGVAVRYLFRDLTILGDPFLSQSETTRYKTTLFGYGSGFTANFGAGGLSYTYYPPLRGKTDIYGEEFIVVEPGEIVADGSYRVNNNAGVGLLFKRWINEIDDRAPGTTAADNQTNISLFGLDPDQYLIPKTLLMIGGDYDFSKALALKVSLGQEEAGFNFRDFRRYNRIDVRQRSQADEIIKYNRLRAVVRFINNNIEFNGGIGLFERKFSFPEQMNSGEYESGGQELFAAVGMKI